MNKIEQQKWMHRAVDRARLGIRKGQTPFGACIVRNGRLISNEHNRVWLNQDITAHAEVVAIREACRKLGTIDLSGCILFSTCEPCPMCYSAAHWARIDHVYFGAAIRDAEKAGFHELKISNQVMRREGKSKLKTRGGVLIQETRGLFTEWMNSGRARTY